MEERQNEVNKLTNIINNFNESNSEIIIKIKNLYSKNKDNNNIKNDFQNIIELNDNLIKQIENNLPDLSVSRDDFINLLKEGKDYLLYKYLENYFNSDNVIKFNRITENASIAIKHIFN